MDLYRAKEYSWLAFNERVLQEAESLDVPLIERFKFLGIYSNNLGEFFRVRVATLKRLAEMGAGVKKIIGDDPKEILQKVNEIVLIQRKRYESLQKSLFRELEQENVFLCNEVKIKGRQRSFALNYFYQKVRPKLMPIMIDQVKKFPDLEDDAIYFATILTRTGKTKERYALVKVPTNELPRFLILPREGEKKFIIFLDDVIRLGLKDLFLILHYDSTNAFTIKLTKDAELDIDDDLGESYVKKRYKGLKKREEGDLVRLVYDSSIPEHFLDYLKERMGLKKEDTLIAGGRYHNLKDFMQMPNLGRDQIAYRNMPNVPHPLLNRGESIISAIRTQDILLHFPYHSFDNFIDLLREASIDPKVVSIQITLYRLAENSNVINALLNAVRHGKLVTVVVELTARFNEKSNIEYSNLLRHEGAKVIYGVQGLKVHAKICQIIRKENRKKVYYSAVGTGNFNEETGKVFSDILLLTRNEQIGSDAASVFNFMHRNYQIPQCALLVPSPFAMRNMLRDSILNEINNAREGFPAYIHLKLNNLADKEVIQLLYDASSAGVEIRLNVRGIFSPILKKDLPETKNIKAIAIIDRFLEHTRLFFFCNNGDEKCYFSSADLMTRNLDRRVELTCPVIDASIQEHLRQVFDIQWEDNTKARILDADLSNQYKPAGEISLRSQMEIYKLYNGKE